MGKAEADFIRTILESMSIGPGLEKDFELAIWTPGGSLMLGKFGKLTTAVESAAWLKYKSKFLKEVTYNTLELRNLR